PAPSTTNVFALTFVNGTTNPGTMNPFGVSVAPSHSLRSAAYGNGFFLAGGTGSVVYASFDGHLWFQTNNVFQNAGTVQALAFNTAASNRFVAGSSIVNISYSSITTNNGTNV